MNLETINQVKHIYPLASAKVVRQKFGINFVKIESGDKMISAGDTEKEAWENALKDINKQRKVLKNNIDQLRPFLSDVNFTLDEKVEMIENLIIKNYLK